MPEGLVAATQINGRALDRVYKHMKARNGGVGQPEFRLRTSSAHEPFLEKWAAYCLVSHCVPRHGRRTSGPADGGMGYTYALDCRRHRTYLMRVGQRPPTYLDITQGFALVGAGMILTFQGMQTYVIDAFTAHAASGMSPSPAMKSYALTRLDSPCGRLVLPFHSGVRLPAVRTCNVQGTRLWCRRHYPRRVCGSNRTTSVRTLGRIGGLVADEITT